MTLVSFTRLCSLERSMCAVVLTRQHVGFSGS